MNSEYASAAAQLTAEKPSISHRVRSMLANGPIRSVIAHHKWFICIVFAYAAAAVFVGHVTGNSELVRLRLYSNSLALLIATIAVVTVLCHTFWVMIFVRPKGSLTRTIISDFKHRFLQTERLLSLALMLVLIPLFFSAFSSFKRLIPYLNYWHLDPLFKDWDRFVHFGRDAWEWTHAVFGTPLLTTGINFFYHAWIFLMLLSLIWQAWNTKAPELRMQYFYSFAIMWTVMGTVMATLLSSTGPVYYGNVTNTDSPFAPLFFTLYEFNEISPVWALDLQDTLWTNYAARATELKSGITAMPSMHVAVAVQLALLGWSYNKAAGIALTAFAIIIQIGSVHLGWHYAIDGYVSTVCVIAIWYGVGRAQRWRAGRTSAA